jgi:O-methyltransferase involved in polyketide biosynthesis
VKAVGIDALTQMFEGDKASDDVGDDGDDGELSLRPMIDPFAARTRFFDNFLTAATDAGIR